MDTATHDAALLDSFLSACVINAVNINVLYLSMMYTGASAELLLVTNHTAMHYWAVALANAEFCPRSALQPRYFLWCWLAFTARSPGTASTKSHFFRWQLFSLCDPQEVFSPWISPRIALLACLHRRGRAEIAFMPEQMARVRQSVTYPLQKKLKKWFIPYESLTTQRRLHSRRTQTHWSRKTTTTQIANFTNVLITVKYERETKYHVNLSVKKESESVRLKETYVDY